MATFWLALAKAGRYAPSWFMAVVTSLTMLRSTVLARSVLSVDLLWCSSACWASMTAKLSVSSPHHCSARRSVSSYRVWAHAFCSSSGSSPVSRCSMVVCSGTVGMVRGT
jgi:hypothetical protein